MPTWDGFKTWLDWEFLFLKVLLVVAVFVWGSRVLFDATTRLRIGIDHVVGA